MSDPGGPRLFHPDWGVPVLLHHSFSPDLRDYDLLVRHFRPDLISTWRYRFTETSSVAVTSLLSEAVRDEARAERAFGGPLLDREEAAWGVALNQVLAASMEEPGAEAHVVIETSAQRISLRCLTLELEPIEPGFTQYVVPN
ncbi:MAG: hypothetical protein JWP66_356 [Naasia sp.]|nr:hypothetical protein [Naasia sp.]